jgi:hypothetical protein
MDAPSSFRFTSSGQKELVITPGQNRFSLDFSVMNYDGDNRYFYQLNGVMNDGIKRKVISLFIIFRPANTLCA